MTVLLTAGTGKTSQKLYPYLEKSNTPFLITSRSAIPSTTGRQYVKFDFADASTYPNAFPSDLKEKVSSVYIIVPFTEPEAAKITNDFIDYALKEHGVKRFVVLTGEMAKKGGPQVGQVWQHLDELDVEYTVLKAAWFIENFSEWFHNKTIKEEGIIYSATESGRAPYVSTDDIARVAFHALTDTTPLPKEVFVLGPELLTLDQAAEIFSDVLGKPVKHVKLDVGARTQYFIEKEGLSSEQGGFIAWLETLTAQGVDDFGNDSVQKYTGTAPKGLRAWVEENKSAFI